MPRPVRANGAKKEEYDRAVADVRMFLEGKKEDLLARLRQKMFEYSERQQYELAANYRDLANTVEELNTRPKLISYELEDADLFGYARSADNIAVQIFFMRNGQIVGRHEFFFESKLVTDSGSLRLIYSCSFTACSAFCQKIFTSSTISLIAKPSNNY